MSLLLTLAAVAALRPAPLAPEFLGAQWDNVVGTPPTLAARRGKPTLVAFWTFGCYNCRNNFPSYKRLYAKYKPLGVELVAIHTPETPGERSPKAVADHVRKAMIDYPVLLDGDSQNWNRWGVQFWPTLFVVDGAGRVRGKWEGELQYNGANGEAQVAATLDRLLKE